jgi:diaminopimelate epimerase
MIQQPPRRHNRGRQSLPRHMVVRCPVTYTVTMRYNSPVHGRSLGLRFLKMHGLGNDFVVIDARDDERPVSPALARALGDRHRGVGYDQLAVMRAADNGRTRVEFWNADGSMAAACGNASRCVARLLMEETGADALDLVTERGVLRAEKAGLGLVRINMGQPQFDWREIPLAREVDINALPLPGTPSSLGMGNPHCVFFVDDAGTVDLAGEGPVYEHHPLFPERTNVEFVEVIDRATIRMRVWERGGMITLACGSGACASAVAAARRGLTDRRVTVHLDGGPLEIAWTDEGVWMTGPTAQVFEGELSAAFLESLP